MNPKHKVEPSCQVVKEALESWPIVVVHTAGQVYFATRKGRKAIMAVSAPKNRQPIQRLDATLMRRIRSAVAVHRRAGQVTLFRRDGVLSHYETHVRRTDKGRLAILLLDARTLASVTPAVAAASLVRRLRRHRKPRD